MREAARALNLTNFNIISNYINIINLLLMDSNCINFPAQIKLILLLLPPPPRTINLCTFYYYKIGDPNLFTLIFDIIF
jgi:hypothetical protein